MKKCDAISYMLEMAESYLLSVAGTDEELGGLELEQFNVAHELALSAIEDICDCTPEEIELSEQNFDNFVKALGKPVERQDSFRKAIKRYAKEVKQSKVELEYSSVCQIQSLLITLRDVIGPGGSLSEQIDRRIYQLEKLIR